MNPITLTDQYVQEGGYQTVVSDRSVRLSGGSAPTGGRTYS